MGLFDGWGSAPWGSQGMMGQSQTTSPWGSPSPWSGGEPQWDMYGRPAMPMNPNYLPQQNPYAQQPAQQGPASQVGSGSPAMVPQSKYPTMTTAYSPSPFSSFKSDYGGQVQQGQQGPMQGPAQGQPQAPVAPVSASASPFAQFGRFGW